MERPSSFLASWKSAGRGDIFGRPAVHGTEFRLPERIDTMDEPRDVDVLGEGKFLRLIRRDGWEYVERTRPIRAVFIAAVTEDGKLLLTDERRVPVGASVVGFPAGLVGDSEGSEGEELEAATRRE